MKVTQMTNDHGRPVANHFIIKDECTGENCVEYLQSYASIIAKRDKFRAGVPVRKVWLDEHYWDYSRTTSKYRSVFLGEDTKTTQAKIKSGEYALVDLNESEDCGDCTA